SDKGRALLSRITIYEPEVLSDSSSDLQPAPKVIQDLIERAQASQEGRHRMANCYLPGTKASGPLDCIRMIVDSCAGPASEELLIEKISTAFNVGQTGADAALRSVKILGLIQRSSATEYEATNAAMA